MKIWRTPGLETIFFRIVHTHGRNIFICLAPESPFGSQTALMELLIRGTFHLSDRRMASARDSGSPILLWAWPTPDLLWGSSALALFSLFCLRFLQLGLWCPNLVPSGWGRPHPQSLLSVGSLAIETFAHTKVWHPVNSSGLCHRLRPWAETLLLSSQLWVTGLEFQ